MVEHTVEFNRTIYVKELYIDRQDKFFSTKRTTYNFCIRVSISSIFY